MRDITSKIITQRTAVARAVLTVHPDTIKRIQNQDIPKGDPLPVAKVAAVQAAKNTPQLIPYCHPVPVDFVGVEFELSETTITVTTTVKANYKTGVEMEALSAAAAAALNLYDMLKMLDETMTIQTIELLEKHGGKSDFTQGFAHRLKAGVVVMSDSIVEGKKTDRSGQLIVDRLESMAISVHPMVVIPDDPEQIRQTLLKLSDEMRLDLIITTGGTGISPRDNTPQVTKELLDLELPGITEAARAYGQNRTPYAMLSRGIAGVRGASLIINLPGSTGGVKDALDALFPAVLHSFKMLWGYGHEKTDTHQTTPKNTSQTTPKTTSQTTEALASR
ncbi:MAG: bifunctional molybdenum cofactor biosynthesis protein MoaC/MoaB [Cyanobacteria bacterium HKST-UBA03]|nr:bifunctional molybdenum cofactor biosynthesis protein MoaC/MoaB [Cyanobacteria bacterium HKST-UBA03]